MDDNLSTNSSESSITTSSDYEIVTGSNVTPTDTQTPLNEKSSMQLNTNDTAKKMHNTVDGNKGGNRSPTLAIANNRNISDLQNEMSDALRDLDLDKQIANEVKNPKTHQNQQQQQQNQATIQGKSMTLPLAGTSSPALIVPDANIPRMNSITNNCLQRNSDYSLLTPKSEEGSISVSEPNRIGHSEFYDCIDASPAGGLEEKQDVMKPEKNDTDEEISEIDQGCTIFSGVTYLGAAGVNAPRSENEVHRIMTEMNSATTLAGHRISISIPNCSDGLVVLQDAENNSIVATYEIQSIIFYYRGPIDSTEHGCFAFTWLLGESRYQCHVFRCHIPEAVNQVSACFQKAFCPYPPSMTCSLTSAIDSNMMNSITSDLSGNPLSTADYEFIVSLEIREKVAKNSFTPVPRDRNCFRLRTNTDKELHITVKQTQSQTLHPLQIERCFGVLVSFGKLVRQPDMQLIDMVANGYQQTTGDSSSPVNCLNPYDIRAEWNASDKAFEALNVETAKTYLTVAFDIVIRGIQEPVRFVIETPVTIQSASGSLMDHFIAKRPLTLRFYLQLKRTTDEYSWKVSSIDPSEEIVEPPSQSSSYLLKFGMNNLTRIVRSSSINSIEDDSPLDYSSDGDEPLLSGTGEVSKDCPQDTLDEFGRILREWDGNKKNKNFASLVRNGVPETCREKLWQKLANVDSKVDMHDMYKTLLTQETKCETVIQRDIHRTFPAHKRFKETGGSGQDALFKVSKAYAVYDCEVGYCQGLSFIAATLLLHMPEEDAFCVLVSLMYDYQLRDMYKQGFEVLYLRLYQLERLIKDQLPKLHEHFTACGIETHMYASQWFLTLFTARFPLCFVFHVMDVFLLDGIQLLFQVALTLLSICENDLRQLDFEGILKYFRVTLPKKCRSLGQSSRIMKMACERKIKKLKQYEEEFLLKKQSKDRYEKESQIYENRFGEERKKLRAEIDDLMQKVAEANERAIESERKHTNIIQDYKLIIQRLENEKTNINETLSNVMSTVAKCKSCQQVIDSTNNENKNKNNENNASITANIKSLNQNTVEAPLGPLDPLNAALQRIRELELELAQAKLAQVEAECKNQDLNHQLSTTITEMQTNRNSWQPWLSKTFNTLQEKVTTRSSSSRDTATFQSYMNNPPPPPPQTSSFSSTTGSEINSPSSNQEFKAFSLGGSPKLPAKFQAAKIRNSIDSLRNIVVSYDTGKSILNENIKHQLQQHPQYPQQAQHAQYPQQAHNPQHEQFT